MPAPKEWYENFKKELAKQESGHKLSGRNTSLYLRSAANEYLFGPADGDKQSAEFLRLARVNLNNLSQGQIDKLYDLSVKGELILAPANGSKDEVRTIFTGEDGIPKLSAANKDIKDNDLPPVAMEALKKYNELSDEEKLSEEKIAGLDANIKTLTDYYKNAKTDELFDSGLVKAPDGTLYKKTEDPTERYNKFFADLENEGVYVQDIEKPIVHLYQKKNGQLQKTPMDGLLISEDIKKETLEQLTEISDTLKDIESKNPYIVALKEDCDATIVGLSESILEKDFKQKLNSFAEIADYYYMNNAGLKMKRHRAEKVDAAEKIRTLRDAVEEGKLPSQYSKDQRLDAKLDIIAAKYVKAYAAVSMKKAPNDEAKDLARRMVTNPKTFREEVKRVKNDPAFMYLYGRDDAEGMKRRNDALTAKSAGILKEVKAERENPTLKKQQLEQYMKQQPKDRMNAYTKGPVTADMQEDIKMMVADMKQRLDALGRSNVGSPEFKQLEYVLTVTNIRMQNGSRYMDVRKQLAELGSAADKYYRSKLREPMTNRRAERFTLASQIRHMCDAVDKNQLPSNVAPSREQLDKENLAAKIVAESADMLMKDKDPAKQVKGKDIMLDAKTFRQEVKKMSESDAFQELYPTDEALRSALKDDASDVVKDMVVAEYSRKPKSGRQLEERLSVKQQDPEGLVNPQDKKEEDQPAISLN